MKKASLHVQQYTAITAHPSRLEIRVSLPPATSLHNKGLNPRPPMCEENSHWNTPPAFFGFLLFCFVFVTGAYSISQDIPEALTLPTSCLSLLCTWEHRPALSGPTFQLVFNHGLIKVMSISHCTNMKPKLLPSKKG